MQQITLKSKTNRIIMKQVTFILFFTLISFIAISQNREQQEIVNVCLRHQEISPYVKNVEIGEKQFCIIEDNGVLFFRSENSANGNYLRLMTIDEMFFNNITDYISIEKLSIANNSSTLVLNCYPAKLRFSVNLEKLNGLWEIIEIGQ